MRIRIAVLAAAFAALALLAPSVHADSAFEPHRNVISAGLGLGVAGIYGSSSSPALSFAFDRGVNDAFSIGGVLGFSSSKDVVDLGGGVQYGWKYSYKMLGVRGAYHLNDLIDDQRVDLYVGGMLGYNMVSATPFSGDQSGSAAALSYAMFGIHAGGRFFFNPKLAGFAELGYGGATVSAGLSMKL